MSSKIIKLENEEDIPRPRNSTRKTKSLLARTLFISIMVFILLMISVLYRGLVLEQYDQFKQIARLNRKHQSFSKPTDTVIEIPESQLVTLEDKDSIENIVTEKEALLSLDIQHGKLKYTRRRLSREINELDPLLMQQNFNLQDLKSKVRSKRERIALSKLEKEYLRCKKAARDNHNDCIVEFVRLYKVAKELSEKMEKMVEMFKDSEQILQQQSSMSDSNEQGANVTSQPGQDKKHFETTTLKVKEQVKLTTEMYTSKNEFDVKTEKTTTAPMPTTLLNTTVMTKPTTLSTTTSTTTTTTTTTTTSTIKPFVMKPVRISWIIDGNDDVEETTQKPTTQATTQSTISKPTTAAQTSTLHHNHTSEELIADIEYQDLTTKLPKSEKFGWILNVKTADSSKNLSTTTPTTPSKIVSTTEASAVVATGELPKSLSTKMNQISSTTSSTATISNLSNTATDKPTTDSLFETERERLRKLKFEWILDGQDGSSEEATKQATTATTEKPSTIKVYPTRPKTIKYDWIVDSDTNNDETLRKSAAKADESLKKPSSAFAFDINKADLLRLPQPNSTHPLDYPTSIENMLGSFEKTEYLRPLKNKTDMESKEQPRYDPIIWAKKFQEAAAKQHQTELLDTFSETDLKNASALGIKLNPTNMKTLNEHDSEILSLCERIAKRLLELDDNVASTGSNVTSTIHFTGRGPVSFPVTGESMKSSAQFMLNPTFGPSFGVPTIPICFYLTPANYRMPTQMPQMLMQPYFGMPNIYNPMGSGLMNANFGVGPTSGGVFVMPQSFGGIGNTGGIFNQMTAAGVGGASGVHPQNVFQKNVSPQTGKPQQFYCTYMQNSANQQGSIGSGNTATNAGGASPLSSSGFTNTNFKLRSENQTNSGVNIIYASYAGLPNGQSERKDQFKCELPEQTACFGGNECIRDSSWCDGIVDCSDGSDEAACSCQDRLPDERLCDGYSDCPMGEDEIGCHGCDSFMYSCYANAEEYKRFNRSTVSMCYSALEKCDGFTNCLNGRDELDCNILVHDVSNHMASAVSTSEGFLYHNHRGQWYPVCNNAEQWAKDACRNEGGYSGVPNITSREQTLPGPFIEPSIIGDAHFPQSCQKRNTQDALVDHATYVKCAACKCGYRKKTKETSLRPKSKRLQKRIVDKNRSVNDDDDDDDTVASEERIVGGKYSKPLEWPFVVAIYRNGAFHCGGSIYNERWIISAAHCVINFQKYYYEVRAGLLRRSSFSAATQTQPVTHVVVHQGYERRSMRNDLSLLRLAEPLQFNRWIKPICMPDVGRTTNGDDWIWGPDPETTCTAVGWGAIREKGPGSDPLREVIIPILKRCTEKMDQQSESICAGEAGGGRDACQGDSGGPLFCRSVANSEEWYLAGVVSHGNGCARPGEYGAYTRVALYLDWLELGTKPALLPRTQPKQTCPGFMCVWGGKYCISERKRCNRIVDCLGGEDEVGCVYNFIPDVGSVQNSTTTESDYFPESETTTAQIFLQQTQGLLENVEQDMSIDKSTTEIDLSTISTTTHELAEQTTIFSVEIPENIEIIETTTRKNESNFETNTVQTTTATKASTTTTTATRLPSTTEKLQKETTTTEQVQEHSSTTLTNFDATSTLLQTEITTLTTIVPDITTEADVPETTTATQQQSTSTTIRPKIQKIAQLPEKFICQRIPQIIEKKHRCDKHVDCEDGTDEEDCRCIDYLKGSLNILVCDGKADCEDNADEENCGQCKPTEFQCPLSKECIPMAKRCNNISDCRFREDEKDCFALTNGRELKVDVNKQPTLSNVGIFTRNSNGVWQVVCSHETSFAMHSAKTAADICALLGFRGFKFYNTTSLISSDQIVVPIDPIIAKRQRFQTDFDISDNLEFSSNEQLFPIETLKSTKSERIHSVGGNCLGLYIECNAASNQTQPLKTLSAAGKKSLIGTNIQNLRPSMQTHLRPNVFVKPELQKPQVVEKKEEILDKRKPIISEDKKNASVLINNQLHEAVEELHWPWLVDVYANGRLWCAGLLLDKYWVLVHESCYFGIRLDTDYVTALLGGGKSKHAPHKSPNELIRRIDCFKSVPNSDVLLYHLERPIHFTHHILPIFLPEQKSINDKNFSTNCMAILQDEETGRIKTVSIEEIEESERAANNEHCQSVDMNCLRLMENAPNQCLTNNTDISCEDLARNSDKVNFEIGNTNLKSLISSSLTKFTTCKQFGSISRKSNEALQPIDQGILVCRVETGGWFPAALFSYNNTDCHSFKKFFGVRSLENVYQEIEHMIEQPKCERTHSQPYCGTFRCPLGKCLASDEVCNGQNDCHDGSDEAASFCLQYKKACEPSEMQCRSTKKCIPKTKFCDHKPDCEDFTDEPTVCSCFTYLRATDPSKICDGIRNCWDKSDESPAICNCTSQLFSCGTSSNECIPHDFVCDKQTDCPNGEDERYCFGIEQPLNKDDPLHGEPHKPPKYGQVIEQSYGIWHTKCFPRSAPPDASEIRQICKKLGYTPYRQPSYRLIDDEANEVIETNEPEPDLRGRSFSNSSLAGKYRYSTKALVVSKFSPLHLNDQLTLFIKPSRPIAELVRWNATDSSHCYRLEIRCG